MTINELLESVRRVEVRTNRLVNDTMVGACLSHFGTRRRKQNLTIGLAPLTC